MTMRRTTPSQSKPWLKQGAGFVAIVGAVLLLAACGGDGAAGSQPSATTSPGALASAPPSAPASTSPATSAATTPTAPRALVVHIRNFAYVPASPIVIVGQPIEIINDDTAAHTWSTAPKSGWAYTSGNLEKGQTATFPGFAKPGSHAFLCYYHAEMPSMNGVVTVRAAP